MDWEDVSSYPPTPVDIVIGSDLVYQKSIAPLLTDVIGRLLRPGGRFLHVAPDTGRDGLPEFLQGLEGGGLGLEKKVDIAAKQEYSDNPFQSQSFEDFMLHFHELATGEVCYRLYEFVKSA